MADIHVEYTRTSAAFGEPALALLYQRNAPAVVAMLRACFDRDTRQIPVARLHQLLDTMLHELRAMGADNVPAGSGRDLCNKLLRNKGWLATAFDNDGEEVYALTSAAWQALGYVQQMQTDRPLASEHRIKTLVDTTRRLNAAVNISRTERLRLLDEQIAALEAQRDRLLDDSQPVPQVTPDFMLEGLAELLAQYADIPNDFRRVGEAFAQMPRRIIEDIRAVARNAGSVVRAYLDRARRSVTDTPEGRSFQGTLELLANHEILAQLGSDLDDLLAHPLAAEILNDTDRRALSSIVTALRTGLSDVLAERARATEAIVDYVASADPGRDRLLDDVLSGIEAATPGFMNSTGITTRTPQTLPLLPDDLELDYLPRAFFDPTDVAPPPPLAPPANTTAADADRDDLAAMIAAGGPDLPALTTALAEALAHSHGPSDLGEMFATLPAHLRRPVDLIGLMHVAAGQPAATDNSDETNVFVTIRPDGSTRTFRGPRTTLTRHREDLDE